MHEQANEGSRSKDSHAAELGLEKVVVGLGRGCRRLRSLGYQ